MRLMPPARVIAGPRALLTSILLVTRVPCHRARLSNIGIGHGALDGGAGYTYFNEQTGYEFSAVAGLTYNFINPHTQYQNGVDVHLDWGASRFLTKKLQIGFAGHLYNQAGCDGGSGDRVGCVQSRGASAGPPVR